MMERRLWHFIRGRCLDGFNVPGQANPYCVFPPLPDQIRRECWETFGAAIGRAPGLSVH